MENRRLAVLPLVTHSGTPGLHLNLVVDVFHYSCMEAESGSLGASSPSSFCTRSRSLFTSAATAASARKRVVDLLWISDDDAFAVAEDDVSRNADDGGIFRHTTQDDGTGADYGSSVPR